MTTPQQVAPAPRTVVLVAAASILDRVAAQLERAERSAHPRSVALATRLESYHSILSVRAAAVALAHPACPPEVLRELEALLHYIRRSVSACERRMGTTLARAR